MGLFSFFKKETEIEKLQKKYKKLLQESFDLSKTDRAASDLKRGEAEAIADQIEQLKNNPS
ncbi:MAG: hypothetical protein CMP61_04705 [Flavobacteriales bacterium]|jgi:hypothetical protein|nr:hypothetical protein [Flavobacteriales bacterium]|tara:strand:+ start:11026 stop:11208 length:183 start_codon:yes stop_codon:yes gene_type:complete